MTNRVLVLFIGLAFAIAIFGGGPTACGAEPNIHATQQALQNDCVVCHQSAYVATLNPKHEDTFADKCENCHATDGWTPLDEIAGETIHEEEAVKSAKLTCIQCHKDDYDGAKDPVHKEATYPPAGCAGCHTTGSADVKSFKPAKVPRPPG